MTEVSFFISYSHADKDLAIAVKAALVARGCAAWRDEDEMHVGDSLVERVADAVHEFEFMAVLVSEESKGSNWCKKELSIAATNGLKDGKVKVLPLRVGDTEMPPVLSDLVYTPIDLDTVDAAAEKLVAAARHHQRAQPQEPQPTAAQSIAAASAAVGEFSYEPIKITGVVAEGIGRPRNDGTRGSAVYVVPLRLSRRPSQAWAEIFKQTWDSPPRFTTVHRPGIGRVSGDRIILDGTTIDEIESVHAETLRHVIPAVNAKVEEIEFREHLLAAQRAEEDRAHEERVRHAQNLRFE
jgi:TIR domain